MSSSTDELSAFAALMPPEYRSAFDLDAARSHAAIVARRGERPVHVEIWRELSDRVVAVCIVADDQPGLFSRISAALVARRIDIVSAHAYCRTREDGRVEAIDILWIRRLPGPKGLVPPLGAEDIAGMAEAIERGTATAVSKDVSGAVRRTTPGDDVPAEPLARASTASARVRFDTDTKDGSTILTVEAVDRPGLLLAVTQALFRAGIQIIGLRATTENGCAVDRFHLAEIDGTPLRFDRLLSLQTAILGALDEGTLAPLRRSAG